MEYCAADIFWFLSIINLILFGLLIYIDGSTFILSRRIAQQLRETTSFLHAILLRASDREGPRDGTMATGPASQKYSGRLQTIAEE